MRRPPFTAPVLAFCTCAYQHRVPPLAQEREAAGRMGASPSPAAQAAPPLLPPLAGLFPSAEPAPGDLPGAPAPLALGPAGMAGDAGEAGAGGGGGDGGGGGGSAWGGSGLQPILAQYRSGDALPAGVGGDGGGAPQGVARPRRMLSETLHEVRAAYFRRAAAPLRAQAGALGALLKGKVGVDGAPGATPKDRVRVDGAPGALRDGAPACWTSIALCARAEQAAAVRGAGRWSARRAGPHRGAARARRW